MIYKIIVLEEAIEDIAFLKKHEISAYHKITRLMDELRKHPRLGTGKPKLLKHGQFKGLWSRRITSKHRLVYSIKDNEITVLVLSAKGHYGDR